MLFLYQTAHTVTIENKITKGALTKIYAWTELGKDAIDAENCLSHCLMHLHIAEEIPSYNVTIDAGESKTRSFTNDRDYCLHLHGGTFNFKIYDC